MPPRPVVVTVARVDERIGWNVSEMDLETGL